eukprot:2043754-Prymnesium_polylepis.2
MSGLCARHAAKMGSYSLQGTTANGSPYYTHAEGDSFYSLYYDPDCSGTGTFPASWILDTGLPDTTRAFDLDNDGTCAYAGDFATSVPHVPLGSNGCGILTSAVCLMYNLCPLQLSCFRNPPHGSHNVDRELRECWLDPECCHARRSISKPAAITTIATIAPCDTAHATNGATRVLCTTCAQRLLC